MAYSPPLWGIWSNGRSVMLETSIDDLDDAKERVWKHFDGGDESVMVVGVCPQHLQEGLESGRCPSCRPWRTDRTS